jgi:topoisomerase IA-like protein
MDPTSVNLYVAFRLIEERAAKGPAKKKGFKRKKKA